MISTGESKKEIQSAIHEFLAPLPEIQKEHSPRYLSMVDHLLHLLTDLETQLGILCTTLGRQRLIYNELVFSTTPVTEDEA